MSDDNVISLAKKTDSAAYVSIEDALREAIDDIGKNGAFKNAKKILILAVDDTNENFDVSFIQAGMKMSQCVTVCEVAKAIFLRSMGYIE